MKTSAVAVRSVLRDGLEHPSGYQTARAGLATFTAVKLYRDGLDGRYKRLGRFPLPSRYTQEGGRRQRGGAARPAEAIARRLLAWAAPVFHARTPIRAIMRPQCPAWRCVSHP